MHNFILQSYETFRKYDFRITFEPKGRGVGPLDLDMLRLFSRQNSSKNQIHPSQSNHHTLNFYA